MKIGQGYVFFTPQWWWIIILCLVIAFSLGWLFPIEGPFDYVYDDDYENFVSAFGTPEQYVKDNAIA